jgi:GGDEF domain-containing protein
LDAWKQLGCMLFEASLDQPLQVLQRRLQETNAAGKDDPGGARVVIDAGSLARAIDRYTTQAQRRVDTRTELLLGWFLALMDHLEKVHAGARDFAQLAQIRKCFDAGYPEEPEQVQELLAGCLSSLKRDFVEKQEAAETLAAALRDRVKLLEQSPSTTAVPALAEGSRLAAPVVDPCTGLPAKAEADAALRRAAGGAQIYAAVFYVERISLINARFGEDLGNEIILFCSQHIASCLTRPNDLLFRWMGPAFVAILEREEGPLAVAREVRVVSARPLSRFFETPSRTVYLPIRLSAETIPMANQTYAAAADQIRNFILQASRTQE